MMSNVVALKDSNSVMKTYLIGYDLKAGQDYESLIQAIKKAGSTWWHNLDSTWLIRADADAGVIRDYLMPHIYKDDKLLVVEIVRGTWATYGFSESAVNWLRSNA
jgi:hypothetical protein